MKKYAIFLEAFNELDSFDDDPDLSTAIFDERYYKASRGVGR